MKIARKEPVFEPIVITIESLDELKWLLSISNTSVTEAKKQAITLGFELRADPSSEQMALWNGLDQYQSLVP